MDKNSQANKNDSVSERKQDKLFFEDEIDLLILTRTLWNRRKFIFSIVGIGFLLGLFIIFTTPKEFKSEAKLLPEYSVGSQTGASSLLQRYSGLLGIGSDTYNSNSNALRVDLYPYIVSSAPFQLELATSEFYIPDLDTTVTLIDYYTQLKEPGILSIIKGYTIGLPGKLISLLPKRSVESNLQSSNSSTITNSILNLTDNEQGFINKLSSIVEVELEKESGIITVSATLDHPLLSAQVADLTIQKLKLYLTEYRTQKLRTDLLFIEQQLSDAKDRFEIAQQELASFREQYQSNLSIRNQTEQQRLNSEYQIAFNLYNSFTQKYEETRLKLQEETPLFKELEPVKVPKSDEASGTVTLIVFILMSIIISVIWVLAEPFIIKLRNGELTEVKVA